MQSVPRISSLVLKTTILLGAVVAVTQPVMGNCGSASIIGTAGAGGNSFIWTQNYMSPMCFSAAYPPFQNNQPPVSPQLEGRFWKLGTGDAATGMGDDNGTFDFVAAGDVLIYTYGPYFFAADLFTTWNPAPVDGVVDGCIGDGNCNCVLLTDQTSNGTVGHFALLAAQSDAAFDTHHNMPGPGTCPTQGGDILIVPMPVPEVTGSTATISMVSTGLYEKDGCDIGTIHYKLYGQSGPIGFATPDNRDRSLWTELTPTPIAVGQPSVVDGPLIPCDIPTEEVIVAASLVFDLASGGGFETTVVSGDGTARVPCCPEGDGDSDGVCSPADCDDANPTCTSDCTDSDSDGFCVTGDCDDSQPLCTSDCTDGDSDGFCVTTDCDDANPLCNSSCTDSDGDGLCATADCDDLNPNCTLDCTDSDSDGFCVTTDCDENYASCAADCVTDTDGDGVPDCRDPCVDVDSDGACAGSDCNDNDAACTTNCTTCPLVCDLEVSAAGCVAVLDPMLGKENFWGPAYPPDQFWTVNVTLGTGYVASAGSGIDAAGNLYTLDPPHVYRYSNGNREAIAMISGNLSRGMALDLTNGKLLLGIWDGGNTMASIIAITGLPKLFDVIQTFSPTPNPLSLVVPGLPEGLGGVDSFDTYVGDLAEVGDWRRTRPLKCGYPDLPPAAGDRIFVDAVLRDPDPGEGFYYVTAVNYQGQRRYGRKRLGQVTSGRDPEDLKACTGHS